MKTKTKEKVYAERQHNYKTKKEEIFKKALDSVPTTDKKKKNRKRKRRLLRFLFLLIYKKDETSPILANLVFFTIFFVNT